MNGRFLNKLKLYQMFSTNINVNPNISNIVINNLRLNLCPPPGYGLDPLFVARRDIHSSLVKNPNIQPCPVYFIRHSNLPYQTSEHTLDVEPTI